MDLEKLPEYLSLASIICDKNGYKDTAAVLLELRQTIYDGTPTVWSNRNAFRKYQGQDNGTYASLKDGWGKYKVIMIKQGEE